MEVSLSRRDLLVSLLSASALASTARPAPAPAATASPGSAMRFIFTTAGRTAIMDAGGGGLQVLDFQEPDQVTWQPAGFFRDGRRILLLSMEARRDGPGRPFAEYYTRTPTHIWTYDLQDKRLTEVATRDRMAVFYTPQLLLDDERMLVQVFRDQVGQIFSMNLDGTDAREFTAEGEGLPYGFSLNRERRRVAFHLASPKGYQVWTSDFDGRRRTLVAAHPDHLYFGPAWSPDGEWLAYQDCRFRQDPGHDWSDVCVSRPDGSEQRVLTQGQSHWFGASYGSPGNRGGGSNMLSWTRDGAILFSRKLPGSKVPWEYQPQRPDTDHFNRDYKPESARGGTEICRIDPGGGAIRVLTGSRPPVWDLRAGESPDGRTIVFCRARTGRMPEIWGMESNGDNARRLTRGLRGRGADHPRWLPLREDA